jgi:hypothetical protein
MLIDQLTPHLPKYNEEVNAHVKRLQTMLDAATVVDPVLDRDDEVRGHELDHRQSPRRDSANSLTPPEERGRMRDQDDRDLCDIIRGRDARDRINNRRQDVSVLSKNNAMRRTMTIMVPSTTNLTDSAPLKEGTTQEESKLFPTI